MTPERRLELDENPFLSLTYEECRAGFHFCPTNNNELVGPFDEFTVLDKLRLKRCWCIPDEEEVNFLIKETEGEC